MVCIVIGARKLGLNPDNIATPIAASLGDLITMSILAFVSSFLYKHKGKGCPREEGPTSKAGSDIRTQLAPFRSGTLHTEGNPWGLSWGEKSYFSRGKA